MNSNKIVTISHLYIADLKRLLYTPYIDTDNINTVNIDTVNKLYAPCTHLVSQIGTRVGSDYSKSFLQGLQSV